ncbi:MAG: cob(I)yrinic acid a,c-diamide adenosyltransferase [Acidimicrobiales bacterium]
MRIYTKKGDDGTTGLLFGGRVPKSSVRIELNGAVDEAQAALGMARAEAGPGSELDELLIELERQLYVLMAEVATASSNRHKLEAGTSLVSEAMVVGIERHIDDLTDRVTMPEEFVIPGQNRWSAALDLARTVVRRAERLAVAATEAGELDDGSAVGRYLNRLSDLLWVMARWQEGDEHVRSRERPGGKPGQATPGFGRRPAG